VAAGHVLMEEAPEQVLQALRTLLAKDSAPAVC
jgi:pimeloyl-ACP methyl ester carboxylesterase